MVTMKLLELFAGSRSVWKEADKLFWKTISSDITPYEWIDYCVDIMGFEYPRDFIPDVIWASPPCTWFSVASIWRNWTKGSLEPKTETARIGLLLLGKTIEIIEYYKALNPNLIWYIENPRWMMRKMPCMKDFLRHTVTYCQYWDSRMKPTDIWTNNTKWKPRTSCKNWDTCHISAPRGSSTGTQWLKGAYERSKIPPELCKEILLSSLWN